MNPFEYLFKPLVIKKVTLRNRIVLPPMNTNFAEPDGSVNERFKRYYVERGKGGAGLLIVSSAYIDPAAKKRVGALLLHEDRFIPKLKDFTDAIHATGAKVLGDISIGANTKVGAGSVVLHDVPDDCTVVGVPGRIKTCNGKRVPDLRHDQLPDPELDILLAMNERIEKLEEKVLNRDEAVS